MRNVLYVICRENENTHFTFSNFFDTHAVYGIMWKNIVELDRPQMVIWHMHIALWIPEATNTCSECAVLTDFLLQQWLCHCASVLHCLPCLYFYFAAVNMNVPLSQCQHIMCMSAISLSMFSTEQWLDLQNSTLTSHCILNTTLRRERGGLLCKCSLHSLGSSYSEWFRSQKWIIQGHFLCLLLCVQRCLVFHKHSLVCTRERLIWSF